MWHKSRDKYFQQKGKECILWFLSSCTDDCSLDGTPGPVLNSTNQDGCPIWAAIICSYIWLYLSISQLYNFIYWPIIWSHMQSCCCDRYVMVLFASIDTFGLVMELYGYKTTHLSTSHTCSCCPYNAVVVVTVM